MATVSAFSAVHCANSPVVVTPSYSNNESVASFFLAPGIVSHKPLNCAVAVSSRPSNASDRWKSRTGVRVFAQANEDEWGEDTPGEGAASNGTTETATVIQEEPSEVKDLKRALMDSLYGTERGLRASSETRAEIFELITQLEAKNPTPAPTEALPLLNGKWVLVYTSFSELFPLLATGTLPLGKVKEISQTIDSGNFTVENYVPHASTVRINKGGWCAACGHWVHQRVH